MNLSIPVLALALLGAAALAAPVAAAEGAAKQGPAEVALPPILAPMNVDGRLKGYAHLTISVRPASPDKLLLVREKVPFLQDAFLRELNRGTIVKADEPTAVDVEAATARLLARAKQVLPPGSVSGVKIASVAYVPVVQD